MAYDPRIKPARFTAKVTNSYLPWEPGRKWIYTGEKDGRPHRVEVTVTNEKKRILGVECVRLFRLVRVGERTEVADDRRVLETGWNPV
jgi:hypothetical protein